LLPETLPEFKIVHISAYVNAAIRAKLGSSNASFRLEYPLTVTLSEFLR